MIIHCVWMQMVCREVPWYKARVSRSMTNDAPNGGWTSMSVLKSRRDFNYSSVWLPAWPSVKTWTEVNYGDDVPSPYLAVYVLRPPPSEMADCQRSLWYYTEGHRRGENKVWIQLCSSGFTGRIVRLSAALGRWIWFITPRFEPRAICAQRK